MIDLVLWKKRKNELNLNYDELSKIANVSKRTIEDIFRGYTTSPRIDTVQAIEKALGISSNELIDSREFELTGIEKIWLDLFREIGHNGGEQAQERAIELVKLAFVKGE